MGVSEDYAKDLINGNVPLTQEIADLLGMTFGIPAGFWLNLEASYRNQLTKVATESSMENQSEHREMNRLTIWTIGSMIRRFVNAAIRACQSMRR